MAEEPAAPAPAEADTGSDGLTADELAHVESRGATELPGADAAPAEPAATPEPAAAAPAAEPAKPPAGYVPHAALHETREQLKAEKVAREQLQRVMDRILTQGGQQPPAAAEQPKAPNVDEDPIAVIRAQGETIARMEQALNQRAADERLTTAAVSREREFMAQTPDYGDAMSYLQQSRDAQLALMGFENQQERANIMANEAKIVAANALNAGENPAQRYYGIAKAMGWQPRAAAPAQPAQAAPAAPNAAERVDTIARGQAASRSLSAAPGAAVAPDTVEALANMSETDFNEWFAKNGSRAESMLRRMH